MGQHCCHLETGAPDRGYRRVLMAALALNLGMFVIEAAAGLAAGSVSLQADALDFFGDAASYGVSLLVLGMLPVWRARAALAKGVSMGLFGLWVLGSTIHLALAGRVPEAEVMGVVGIMALVVNLGVAVMLYRHRGGDANRRSVWLCSRNDAIGNVAVVIAAFAVGFTGSAWPDLLVGAVMATLALASAASVLRQALAELTPAPSRKRESEIA